MNAINAGVRKAIVDLYERVLSTDSRQGTKYLADNLTVKFTRKSYAGKPERKNARGETYLLTVGKPNYAERKQISFLKKKGVEFPAPGILLRPFTLRKKVAA